MAAQKVAMAATKAEKAKVGLLQIVQDHITPFLDRLRGRLAWWKRWAYLDVGAVVETSFSEVRHLIPVMSVSSLSKDEARFTLPADCHMGDRGVRNDASLSLPALAD